ncbi:MAG TPA: hypothetical protein VKC51_11760 [Lacunisphaera sp.]|nr:hypothetical protein [Lacunisphaera sp.]
MKHRIPILIGAGVTCLAFAATAWNEARSAQAAEALLAKLASQRTDLTHQLALNSERIVAAEAEQGRLQKILDGKHATPKADPRGSPKVVIIDPKTAAAAEVIARTPWRDVVLEKNPELQARYLASRRRDFGVTYGPFLMEAGLSQTQIERFKDILVTEAENAMDLKSTMRARGLAETDPAVQTLRNQSEEAMRAAKRELLGEAGYQQLVEFERTMPTREFVGGLAASLVFSGDPISATQANQLTQILADASEAYRNGAQATSPRPDLNGPILARQPARESVDSERLLAQARTALSPAQYATFEAEILRNRTIIELFNVIRQAPGDPIMGFTIVGRN